MFDEYTNLGQRPYIDQYYFWCDVRDNATDAFTRQCCQENADTAWAAHKEAQKWAEVASAA